MTAAPAGLALTVGATALASAAAKTGLTAMILKTMTLTNVKAGLLGAILIGGVAAPILGTNEQAIAGISVAGPAFRLDDSILPTVIAAVQNAARVIRRQLRDLDM